MRAVTLKQATCMLVILPVVAWVLCLAACYSREGQTVRFSAVGRLGVDRVLSITVENNGLEAVVIHPRDYLFLVSCRSHGGEVLLRPDQSIEWSALEMSNGIVVGPQQTRRIEVAFRGAPATAIGCVPTEVVYTWPKF